MGMCICSYSPEWETVVRAAMTVRGSSGISNICQRQPLAMLLVFTNLIREMISDH